MESAYTDTVALKLLIPYGLFEELQKDMVEATNGKVTIERLRELYYVSEES